MLKDIEHLGQCLPGKTHCSIPLLAQIGHLTLGIDIRWTNINIKAKTKHANIKIPIALLKSRDKSAGSWFVKKNGTNCGIFC